MTDAWAPVLARWRRGETSAPLALAGLLLAGGEEDVVAGLERVGEPELAALARAHAAELPRLRALAAAADHSHLSLVGTRAMFEALAAAAPEAAVAFYSLNDPALLDTATRELVAVIVDWTAVDGRDLVDLGCGIGRVARALAGRARSIVGLDLSPRMVA